MSIASTVSCQDAVGVRWLFAVGNQRNSAGSDMGSSFAGCAWTASRRTAQCVKDPASHTPTPRRSRRSRARPADRARLVPAGRNPQRFRPSVLPAYARSRGARTRAGTDPGAGPVEIGVELGDQDGHGRREPPAVIVQRHRSAVHVTRGRAHRRNVAGRRDAAHWPAPSAGRVIVTRFKRLQRQRLRRCAPAPGRQPGGSRSGQ
jgi:hypothetical protein